MLITLTLCAVLTSIISGVIGMGGGVLLLAIMTFFVSYELLIPIHGIVQLVSNSSRTFYLRKNIRLDFFIPFLIGAPFGFILAYFILRGFKLTNYYYLILGLFVLYNVFKPKYKTEIRLQKKGWALLGFFAGIQGSLIGVTGPLIAPFYLRTDISKEEVVATKAMQQIITHFLKIPLFLSLDFDYFKHFNIIILMSTAALIGTFYGVKLLAHIDHLLFRRLYRSVLFLAALKLLFKFGSSL
jgi:uncharacterized protein